MTRSLIHQLFAASVCLLASPLVNAASPNCAAMEDAGPQWFATQLDAVQASYQSGNSQGAYQQLRSAMMGLPRRADVSLDARCVGPTGWQRMYQLRGAITQSLGQAAEEAGRLTRPQGALDWYVTGDNQADARRVIPKLTPETKGTAWVISRLRNEIALLVQATAAGFDLLPEEQAARKFWQRGLDGTIRYARSKVAEGLQAEAGLLTREVLDEEMKIEEGQRDRLGMAAAYFGDASLAPDMEAQREANRAEASLTMLETARDWAAAVAAEDTRPVNDRAVERGDALLARAGDTALGIESRDLLYQEAEAYFKFADNRERLRIAELARAQIAPAVKTEVDQRNARIGKERDKMRASAQQMKQSLDKTEAQKKGFKEEADALEAELGF